MNEHQSLWWEQALSDHRLLLSLIKQGVEQCHLLHYLQMATEKLTKAYLWRSGKPPLKSHKGFRDFFRLVILSQKKDNQKKIAELFQFNSFQSLKSWSYKGLPIVYEIERLAPSLSNNGPNPEYPWPHDLPEYSPVNFSFPAWSKLTETAEGRHLMKIIQIAIVEFPKLTSL